MDTGTAVFIIVVFAFVTQVIIWAVQRIIERRRESERLVSTVVKGNVKASETIVGSLAELSGVLEKLDRQ